jgi:hypothetical protein
MVVALIAVGVIAFLVVDGIILMKVLGGAKNAGAYGSSQIPGSTQVTLPAGKVKLNYVEARKAASDGDTIYFSRPDSLQVAVTPVGGGPALEMKGPGFRGMGSSQSVRKGFSSDLIGTVEVTQPGAYNVEVTGVTEPDAVEPQVLIGK